MAMDKPQIIDDASPPASASGPRDDVAYILPMLTFLLFTWVGGQWQSLYAASYMAKTAIVACMLLYFRRRYTPIRWNGWWLGILLGVAGVVQWVGMERLIGDLYPKMSHHVRDPHEMFSSTAMMWAFIAIRWAGASLLVPVMEELFWRDYLWRQVISPNDFKLAGVGEWNLGAFLVVAVFFGAGVHIEWLTAIVYGLMIGALLAVTRSLGACIVMHAVTNFLLGAYVLKTGQWIFW